MERTYEEYSINCKNCGNLIHFPGDTYLSSSNGTCYPKYHCIERNYIFNSRNVPLQKPCGAFTPTLWCLIKHTIKKIKHTIKKCLIEKNKNLWK